MKKFISKVLPISLAAVLVLGLIPSVGVKAMDPNIDNNQAVAVKIDTLSFSYAQPKAGDALSINSVFTLQDDTGVISAEFALVDSYEVNENGGDGQVYNPVDGEKYEAETTYHYEAYVHFTDMGYSFANKDDMAVSFTPDGATCVFGWWDEGGGMIYGDFTVAAAEEQKEEAKEETKEETKEEAKEETAPAEEKKEEAAAPAELKILDGADQEVDGTGDVTIRANGEFANFDKLLMDEKEVDPSNYDKKEGSTIVTLKAAYVASLGAGAHTVSFVYKDGSAVKTTLTLKAAGNSAAAPAAENTSTPAATPAPAAAATDSVAPKTGENIMWIYVILAMSALGMGVTAVSIKKNK